MAPSFHFHSLTRNYRTNIPSDREHTASKVLYIIRIITCAYITYFILSKPRQDIFPLLI